MSDWFELTDDLGPEKIIHLHDAETGMKAVIVVDTMFSGFAGGGTRMLPDISTKEMAGLARAMTYKLAMIDLPMGGAKSGIWGEPGMSQSQKEAYLKSFGKLAKPIMESGLAVGADMGTSSEDVELIYQSAGIDFPDSGLTASKKDGEPMENHATGYGVVVAAKAGCKAAGIELEGATVAIEGFGKAAGGVARYMLEAGARIVAMSNIDGTRYNEKGLDVAALLEARKEKGDQALTEYEQADSLPCQDIFTMPVDIVVPGTRPFVIDGENAPRIQAAVIASIANNPVSNEAEEILLKKGVRVIPDFLCNVGGLVLATIDLLGGSEADLFNSLDHLISDPALDILVRAEKAGIPPRLLAEQEIKQKLIKRRTEKTEQLSIEDTLNNLSKRFKMS